MYTCTVVCYNRFLTVIYNICTTVLYCALITGSVHLYILFSVLQETDQLLVPPPVGATELELEESDEENT